jgi:hypothetical protein
VHEDLSIDYGKIDYAIDCEGVPVLFDLNKTIGLNNPNSERALKGAWNLADGLGSLVDITSRK